VHVWECECTCKCGGSSVCVCGNATATATASGSESRGIIVRVTEIFLRISATGKSPGFTARLRLVRSKAGLFPNFIDER
jgi:hypothetical protein